MIFVKTSNLPISMTDVEEELKARDIEYKIGDEGFYVSQEDEDTLDDILIELCEEEK